MNKLPYVSSIIIGRHSKITTRPIVRNYKKFKTQTSLQYSKKRKTPTENVFKIINALSNTSIYQYINQDEIFHLKPFFKPRTSSNSSYCFTIDYAVANDFVNKIKGDIQIKKCLVFEGNPGLGLVTHFLTKAGADVIHIFDDRNLKQIVLKQMLEIYKHNLQPVNIFTGYNNKCNPIIKFLRSSTSTETKCVIGVVPNYSFFSELVYSVLKNQWELFDDVIFYLVIGSKVQNKIVGFNENHSGRYFVYCMFNFFFKAEKMAEYPTEAFLPVLKNEGNKMYLIKISLRKDAFDVIDKKVFPVYVAFMRILSKSRYTFLISSLENWIPGCGPCLISKGISLTTQTLDLSPSETVKLFSFLMANQEHENLKILSESFAEDNQDFE